MKQPDPELTERAKSIFDQLGYTVIDEGGDVRAERDWKVVYVTPMRTADRVPEAGSLRCFVTPQSKVSALRQRLREDDPDYEWAIIGVDGDDYEVARAPPGPDRPPESAS